MSVDLPPEEETWGEPRHPSINLRFGGDFATVEEFDIHHHRYDSPEYVVAAKVGEPEQWLLDAERKEQKVAIDVYGVREGDTWRGEVSVKETVVREDGYIAKLASDGENGTLFRLAATGCLICEGGDENEP